MGDPERSSKVRASMGGLSLPGFWGRVFEACLPVVPLAILGLLAALLIRGSEGGPPTDLETFEAAIRAAEAGTRGPVYSRLIAIAPPAPAGGGAGARTDSDYLVWHPSQPGVLLVASFVPARYADKYRAGEGTAPKYARDDENAYLMWVTAVPELQQFCRGVRRSNLRRRVQQYLGLRPVEQEYVVVQMWVDHRKLFRPCADPETDDAACQPDPPAATASAAPGIDDYRDFYRSLGAKSYRPTGAPWTRRGYTYDWANGDRGVGASEFVLGPGSKYEVESVSSLEGYCSPLR